MIGSFIKKKWYIFLIIALAIVALLQIGGYSSETDVLNSFVNDTGAGTEIIDADDVNLNFSLITGNLYPRNTAGLRLNTTYDLGSSTYKWSNLHIGTAIEAPLGTLNIKNIKMTGVITGEPVSLMFELPTTAYLATKIDSVLIEKPFTITGYYAYADTSSEGASIIIDVNKNGTSLFPTQTNRVTIPAHTLAGVGTVETATVAAGDRLSWDIDQTGVSVLGGNFLMLTIKGTTL